MIDYFQTEYFQGERFLGDGVVGLHNGKAELQWVVHWYWDELVSCPLKCGQKYSKTLSRRSGISKTDREELEAAVKADLSVLGFAGLTTELTGTLGREITFEVEEAQEETFTWEAPPQGSLNVLWYQLVEKLSFDYRDFRFLRRGTWRKVVRRRLTRYYNGSRGTFTHPDCGPVGPVGSAEGGPTGLLLADAGTVIFLLGYRADDKAVLFPGLNLRTPEPLQVLLSRKVLFHWKDLPAADRFFLGEEQEMVGVRLRPFEGEYVRVIDAAREEIEVSWSEQQTPEQTRERFGVMEEGTGGALT